MDPGLLAPGLSALIPSSKIRSSPDSPRAFFDYVSLDFSAKGHWAALLRSYGIKTNNLRRSGSLLVKDMDMEGFTLDAVWLVSLFVTASLSWIVGKKSASTGMISVTSGNTPGMPSRLSGLAPVAEFAFVDRRRSANCIAVPALRREMPQGYDAKLFTQPAQPRTTRRANVFEDMPPVETVRAEARAILDAEDVWSPGDSTDDMHHVTTQVETMPVRPDRDSRCHIGDLGCSGVVGSAAKYEGTFEPIRPMVPKWRVHG